MVLPTAFACVVTHNTSLSVVGRTEASSLEPGVVRRENLRRLFSPVGRRFLGHEVPAPIQVLDRSTIHCFNRR